MRTYTLLLACLFISYFTTFAQVPFQGVITTKVLPIKKAYLQENIQVVYHNSFEGNLKVFVNEKLIFDKEVTPGETTALNLGGTIKRSPQTVMKIVLDDLFYLEQVINFHHPFIRINYQKENRQLALYLEDALPSMDEMQSDQFKEQVAMSIRKRLTELDKE